MKIHRDGPIVRQTPYPREDLSPRSLAPFFPLNQRLNLRTEPVQRRIVVPPWIRQRCRVEGPDGRLVATASATFAITREKE